MKFMLSQGIRNPDKAGRQVNSSLSVSVVAGRRRYYPTHISRLASRASPTFSLRSLAEL